MLNTEKNGRGGVAQAMSRLALIGLGQIANELEAAGRSGYGGRTQYGPAGNLRCKDQGSILNHVWWKQSEWKWSDLPNVIGMIGSYGLAICRMVGQAS